MKLGKTPGKRTVILIHIAVWILFLMLTIVSRPSFEAGRFSIAAFLQTEQRNFFTNFFQITFFYGNAYFLIPKLAYKKKYVALVISWLLILMCYSLGGYLIHKYYPQRPFMIVNSMPDTLRNAPMANIPNMPVNQQPRAMLIPSFFFGIFPFLTILGLSTTFRLVSDKVKDDRLMKERENEGLKTELSFLRSQTSPHFLFNIMNSMVAMARLKSAHLEPSLIQLSGLLRYMLYNTDESKVPLAEETSFLNSYIDLQKMRFGDDIEISADISNDGSVPDIEPMLLIPFVENAFKHGVGIIQDPFIHVCLQVIDRQLLFMVHNKYSNSQYETKDGASGIGLVNVSRRLKLLYPDNHRLAISTDDTSFKILLTLNF